MGLYGGNRGMTKGTNTGFRDDLEEEMGLYTENKT